jgi:hypothetical protein
VTPIVALNPKSVREFKSCAQCVALRVSQRAEKEWTAVNDIRQIFGGIGLVLLCLVGTGCRKTEQEGLDPSDTDTNADTDADSDTDSDADTDTDADTNTHGLWYPTSCGHFHCGTPPDCEAIIPGCNCGVGWEFDENEGCIASDECPSCPDPDDPEVAYVRHSYLNPAVCDIVDYQCEEDKYIPFECGCGCIKSEAWLQCEGSGGEWVYMSCGNWHCGEMPACDEFTPGCNCGEEKNVDSETLQCVVSEECLERR